MTGSLLDLRIAVSDPDLEVDLLPPPTKPVEKIPVECAEGSDVDDLDAWSPIRLVQESRKDWEDGGLCLSARGR